MAVKRKQKQYEFKSLKGALAALLVTVFSVLILAVAVKGTSITDETISALNQAIKIVSIFVGAFVASRGAKERQALAGGLAGGIYIVLGYLTFSLIEGRFGDILLLFADLAMGVVIGMLTGIIFGKLLAKKEQPMAKKRVKKAY